MSAIPQAPPLDDAPLTLASKPSVPLAPPVNTNKAPSAPPISAPEQPTSIIPAGR